MSNQKHQTIKLELLVPFANHPFEPYDEKRLADMVDSVKDNGVIVAIIVRPVKDGKFEILSGHNRVEAAKKAGLKEIPAVVRDNLTEDECMLIVTETNFRQRSIEDMKHSELAKAITAHHEATKRQGKRTDLIKLVDDLQEVTSRPPGAKLAENAEPYEISARTISRYLRIGKLIPELQARLDNEEYSLRTGEALSYLNDKEQKMVHGSLTPEKRIFVKHVDDLRAESKKGELTKAKVKEVLAAESSEAKIKPIKFSGEFLSKHFNARQSREYIEDIVSKALEQYFKDQKA